MTLHDSIIIFEQLICYYKRFLELWKHVLLAAALSLLYSTSYTL